MVALAVAEAVRVAVPEREREAVEVGEGLAERVKVAVGVSETVAEPVAVCEPVAEGAFRQRCAPSQQTAREGGGVQGGGVRVLKGSHWSWTESSTPVPSALGR